MPLRCGFRLDIYIMIDIKKGVWAVLLCISFMLGSCKKDDSASGNEELPDIKKNTMVVDGTVYPLNPNGAKYYSGMYAYMGMECTNFYIECSQGAGLTIEVDETLVGQTVSFEPGDTFWFFAVGNGNGTFVPLQHDGTQGENAGLLYKENDYSGWSRLERDLRTDYCTLLFVINRNEVEGWATGKIRTTFSRLTSL